MTSRMGRSAAETVIAQAIEMLRTRLMIILTSHQRNAAGEQILATIVATVRSLTRPTGRRQTRYCYCLQFLSDGRNRLEEEIATARLPARVNVGSATGR